MNNKNYLLPLIALLATTTLILSCKKDNPDDVTPPEETPVEQVEFEISQTEFKLDAQGTPMQFTIDTKYDWELSVPAKADWCEISPLSGGPGKTTVTITPTTVTDRTPRNRQFLTLTYGETYIMLSVSQDLPNNSPSEAKPSYPTADASDVKINVEFTWGAATDSDGDPVSYSIMISEDGGESWNAITTTSTRAKLEYLLNKNTKYVWKVVSEDNLGGKTESAEYSFTTGDGGAYKDGEVSIIQMENAGAPKPVHLVITGDGFIEEDYVEGGVFDQAVEKAVEAFFSIEPYPTYRHYFRVSTIAAYSQERGATVKEAMKDCPAQTKNTIFKSTLDGGTSTNTTCDYDKVYSYALKVPDMTPEALENSVVIVIINLDAYAGTCVSTQSGRSVSMCPMGKSSFEKVVSHEAGGHGFGRLLDEYRYYDNEVPTAERDRIRDWRKSEPHYANNISLTGNRDEVHWKDYFSISGYEAVGMYEGALLYKKGVWRPEEISCMEDNRSYYNAPSREAIVRRIMTASGKTFSFESFLAKDVTTMPQTVGTRSLVEEFIPLGETIFIDNM